MLEVVITTLLCLTCVGFASGFAKLRYAPAPVDNPLKGLVPYTWVEHGRFPHSMEFSYVPMSDLMQGHGRFTWEPLDRLIGDIAGRGHQTVFRIWVEYPGKPSGLPAFLRAEGVRVEEYKGEDASSHGTYFTPDYSNPNLQAAISEFVAALGRRYDGDPRVGFVTAGLLGYWGEWHTFPRVDLYPGHSAQVAVMDAYQSAFKRTRVLLRYPTGGEPQYAPNAGRPFGYHDDSFAWATLPTDRPEDGWFFVPRLKDAGALDRWKSQPIGGEIRPEAWGKVFDPEPTDPNIQSFLECVNATHCSWLMDTGMFREAPSPERFKRASEMVRRMGYELTIESAGHSGDELTVVVRNRGVAPFYYPWPVELAFADAGGIRRTWKPGWSVAGVLPGAPTVWRTRVKMPKGERLLLRVPNPMAGGHPLRFANEEEDRTVRGWLTLL